jgi:hypothetical protein
MGAPLRRQNRKLKISTTDQGAELIRTSLLLEPPPMQLVCFTC